MKLTGKVVSPDSRLGTVAIYIQYIYITKIVVLVSEPVRGRSRATELPCLSRKMLPEDSRVFLGWIVLKVIFKGYIPVGQIWLFHLEPIFSKFDNFSLFGMKLPKEGTNELSKDGFDSITLKVIYQGPKKDHSRLFFYFFSNFLNNGLITFYYNFVRVAIFLFMFPISMAP